MRHSNIYNKVINRTVRFEAYFFERKLNFRYFLDITGPFNKPKNTGMSTKICHVAYRKKFTCET